MERRGRVIKEEKEEEMSLFRLDAIRIEDETRWNTAVFDRVVSSRLFIFFFFFSLSPSVKILIDEKWRAILDFFDLFFRNGSSGSRETLVIEAWKCYWK